MVETLSTDPRDIMAVGHTSVILDEFNTLYSFGCNIQGQLGDKSDEEFRSVPGKLGREFILDQVVLLRGHYEEYYLPNQYGIQGPQGRTTLSFMNEKGEIYVWGCFKIPANGS